MSRKIAWSLVVLAACAPKLHPAVTEHTVVILHEAGVVPWTDIRRQFPGVTPACGQTEQDRFAIWRVRAQGGAAFRRTWRRARRIPGWDAALPYTHDPRRPCGWFDGWNLEPQWYPWITCERDRLGIPELAGIRQNPSIDYLLALEGFPVPPEEGASSEVFPPAAECRERIGYPLDLPTLAPRYLEP